EFTGNQLPEENRRVALCRLSFAHGPTGRAIAIGEVPPVLLSECLNDMRRMSADGPGFDPDWENLRS
ncbi:MAG: hypothetical protein AB1758_16285, partial [Candidatus Eremiobacterota bacterium]